jgi:hypothetical protein
MILSSNDDLSYHSLYSSSMLSMDASGPVRPGDVCVLLSTSMILSSKDDLSYRSVYSSSMLSMDASGPVRPGDVCVALYLYDAL